jgi:RimJ/RimL family protein N-acetyltransferase
LTAAAAPVTVVESVRAPRALEEVAMTTTSTETVEPQLVIAGERAALGPIRADLLPLYRRWVNDRQVARGLGVRTVMTEEAERAWYDEASRPEANQVNFTIYDQDDLTPVGTTGLFGIDHYNARATFGIMVGERRGQGLGTEATRLVLEWGFTVLGLYNVELKVWEWNAAAIRAYTKAGFREIGRRRGAAVVMGRRFDEVLMDAIASEFDGSALAGLVPDGGRPLRPPDGP